MNAPAGFWRRYAAYSFDVAILVALASPLLWHRLSVARPAIEASFAALQLRLLQLFERSLEPETDPLALMPDLLQDAALQSGITTLSLQLTALSLTAGGVLVALAAVWFIGSESSRWQASPGKRLVGVRVTDVSGARCGPGRIALRFVAGTPSWLLLNLGHALAAWTPGKRALHDYLAGTRVELAPGASPAMPRRALSWLLLQATVFFGLVGWVMFEYARMLVEAAESGLP